MNTVLQTSRPKGRQEKWQHPSASAAKRGGGARKRRRRTMSIRAKQLKKDTNKQSGSSPTSTTETLKPVKKSAHPEHIQPWFVVDKEGLRKTLSRKSKAFEIYE